MLKAFQQLCLPAYKDRTLDEYIQTIIKELSDGLNAGFPLPFISLHFNTSARLYSVMHEYYKTTLVGNAITYLDYFLKG